MGTLKYFEDPFIAELVSSRLGGGGGGGGQGLHLRLFQTFLRAPLGIPQDLDPFESMSREDDIVSAAEEGRFGAVKWLFRCMKGAPDDGDEDRIFARICCSAASGGHLEILKLARENDCPWYSDTCVQAAKGGHIDVLKWAFENGCPCDEKETCSASATGGHIGVLEWARESGIRWNESACAAAASGGNL